MSRNSLIKPRILTFVETIHVLDQMLPEKSVISTGTSLPLRSRIMIFQFISLLASRDTEDLVDVGSVVAMAVEAAAGVDLGVASEDVGVLLPASVAVELMETFMEDSLEATTPTADSA